MRSQQCGMLAKGCEERVEGQTRTDDGPILNLLFNHKPFPFRARSPYPMPSLVSVICHTSTVSASQHRDRFLSVCPPSLYISGSGFDPHPQRLPIFHLILGGRGESLLRKPGFPHQGSESSENCRGSSFWPEQVRISIRDLFADRNAL